jgi:hypothetical protein
MIKPGLANVYRRFTRRQPASEALPQVDTLLAVADGEHGVESERLLTEVGRSGLHADLLRLARALSPESARLGVQLEQAFDATSSAGHRRDRQRQRNAAPQRGWLRTASALAAGLLVAVAVWSFQRSHALAPAAVGQHDVAVSSKVVPDRIFAALSEGNGTSSSANAKRDEIFRADFKSDRIFKSSEG